MRFSWGYLMDLGEKRHLIFQPLRPGSKMLQGALDNEMTVVSLNYFVGRHALLRSIPLSIDVVLVQLVIGLL